MDAKAKRCLVVVDVQNDFCPGGALGVPGGDEVLPVLNAWIDDFIGLGLPVVYTQDWHPPHHCSFLKQGGTWPPHCVIDSFGAQLHKDLTVEGFIFRKGSDLSKDAYLAFDGELARECEIAGQIEHVRPGSKLGEYLKRLGVTELVVGGLATDYCVKATVLDALSLGFSVSLIKNGVRAVNVAPGDGEKALRYMLEKGAKLI